MMLLIFLLFVSFDFLYKIQSNKWVDDEILSRDILSGDLSMGKESIFFYYLYFKSWEIYGFNQEIHFR